MPVSLPRRAFAVSSVLGVMGLLGCGANAHGREVEDYFDGFPIVQDASADRTGDSANGYRTDVQLTLVDDAELEQILDMLAQARTAYTRRGASVFPTLVWSASGTAVTLNLPDLGDKNEDPEREEEMVRLAAGLAGGSAQSVSGSQTQIEIDRGDGDDLPDDLVVSCPSSPSGTVYVVKDHVGLPGWSVTVGTASGEDLSAVLLGKVISRMIVRGTASDPYSLTLESESASESDLVTLTVHLPQSVSGSEKDAAAAVLRAVVDTPVLEYVDIYGMEDGTRFSYTVKDGVPGVDAEASSSAREARDILKRAGVGS